MIATKLLTKKSYKKEERQIEEKEIECTLQIEFQEEIIIQNIPQGTTIKL